MAPHQFKLEFDKKLGNDQVTVLNVFYNGGSVQSVSFTPTDLYTARTGTPLQFDLTGMQVKDNKVERILLRNVGSTDLVIEGMEVRWTGGDPAQQLKKIKQEKPSGQDFTSGLPSPSPANVPVSTSLEPTTGGPVCSYTLSVDYLDSASVSQRSTLVFDDTLTGIGGYPLEIDLDEAVLDSDKNIRNVRIRSAHDDELVVTGVWLDWSGATDGQKLRKIRDVTDGGFDVVGSGSTPPVGASGLSLGVGGVQYSGASCPADLPDGESASGTGSSGSGPDSTGTDSGTASGGTEIDGGQGTDVGELSGFSITSTTTAASGRGGRLVWREVVR